jgi:quercetin dioxygenase-like cupin family protein
MTEPLNLGPVVAALGAAPWLEEAPGIHSRSAFVDGVRCAVVRYAAHAERDEWCTDGHRGYVIHGHLSYELSDGDRLEVPDGAAFWLPPGSGHRGVNGDTETQLFLIDVPDESAVAET